MPSKFKRIHMPKPLYQEIEKFVQKPNAPYKTIGGLCTQAGKLIIKHYNLR